MNHRRQNQKRGPRALTAYAVGALVVVTLASLAWAQPANACTCAQPPPARTALAASGTVLEGRVVSLKHERGVHRVTATLQVLRRWKGVPSRTSKSIEAVTIDEGSLCGFHFERDKAYLLYAPEAETPISVSACSRSRASADAAADFDELDKASSGAPPTPEAPSAAPSAVVSSSPASSSPASSAALPAPTPSAPTPSAGPPRGGGCAGCHTATSRGGTLTWLGLVALALLARARARRS